MTQAPEMLIPAFVMRVDPDQLRLASCHSRTLSFSIRREECEGKCASRAVVGKSPKSCCVCCAFLDSVLSLGRCKKCTAGVVIGKQATSLRRCLFPPSAFFNLLKEEPQLTRPHLNFPLFLFPIIIQAQTRNSHHSSTYLLPSNSITLSLNTLNHHLLDLFIGKNPYSHPNLTTRNNLQDATLFSSPDSLTLHLLRFLPFDSLLWYLDTSRADA